MFIHNVLSFAGRTIVVYVRKAAVRFSVAGNLDLLMTSTHPYIHFLLLDPIGEKGP